MPFKSQAQRRFLYARHPKIAVEFSSKTPKGNLPEKIHKKKYRLSDAGKVKV